ncbi:MAG TPA: helix-turn-helix transcriptional regulator [Streptosporangiaceae bacterium]
MAAGSIRMTTATLKVLEVLAAAGPAEPPFGLRICDVAGLGSGTVYPILDRLERAGWVIGEWETGQPAGRPRRRGYRLTGAGQAGYDRALARIAERRARRRWDLAGDARGAEAAR